MWIDEQLKRWHFREQKYLADSALVTDHRNINQQRLCIQQEMLQILNSFFARSISLREFSVISQKRLHETWDIWHLKSGSGGLFLNKLIKYIPEEETLGLLLRIVLRIPTGQQDGLRHMQGFIYFLEEVIASRKATRAQLQPARIPLFLSTWWHMQEAEHWPIFYLETRQVLLPEKKGTKALPDLVESYFAFKDRFLALKHALDLSSWELEQLITWHYAQSIPDEHATFSRRKENKKNQKDGGALIVPGSAVRSGGNMIHKKTFVYQNQTYIQWLLAKIGIKIGCEVWIAAEDHEKSWSDDKLGDLSLASLPLLAEPVYRQAIEHIDVLWMCKNEIIAAYEVEQNGTEISKSLLRLSDLAALASQQDTPLCVVTPQRYFEQVQSELSHPIFQCYGMHKRSKVIIQEPLIQHAEHILRWASSPSVVQDLVEHLSAGGR